ncbi:MAG: bifunctional riboflavin kinase/FAD synthetase [Bacillota bacterium]
MELIYGTERWTGPEKGPLYLALGNFDGVHLGHQTIIESAVRQALAGGGTSAALIFDPHPSMLLRPGQPFALLTDIVDRAEMMADLGLDYLIVEPFTVELAALTPEQFVRLFLQKRLGVSGVVVGNDYSFGHRGAGSAETMRQWGNTLGFSVDICRLVRYGQRNVSSSEIRKLLTEGAVEAAARLLNYYFFRRGRVVHGRGIGGKLLFPTANISALPHLIWPGCGVYLTAVGGFRDRPRFAVTNVGCKPTFALETAGVETHILDFEGDLYHRELSVHFLEKLRDTRTFESADQLKKQIYLDIERSRELIENRFRALPVGRKGFDRLGLAVDYEKNSGKRVTI